VARGKSPGSVVTPWDWEQPGSLSDANSPAISLCPVCTGRASF
jgi:hypothetical protein